MTESVKKLVLIDEEQQVSFAATVANFVNQQPESFVIFLSGDLGVGKTTFARGFILACGYEGIVKSPTYTLVEPYPLRPNQLQPNRHCYHFDLYRLAEPEELEFIGAREYFNDSDICLVEWPERAEGFLPLADWICDLSYHEKGRNLLVSAQSEKGKRMMLQVFSNFNSSNVTYLSKK